MVVRGRLDYIRNIIYIHCIIAVMKIVIVYFFYFFFFVCYRDATFVNSFTGNDAVFRIYCLCNIRQRRYTTRSTENRWVTDKINYERWFFFVFFICFHIMFIYYYKHRFETGCVLNNVLIIYEMLHDGKMKIIIIYVVTS